MSQIPIRTLTELKERRKKLLNKVNVAKKSVTRLDKVAIWITNHVGSMGFFVIIFIWTAGWLGWNILAPKDYRFDAYPGFILWLFISNLVQLFLMPLIMIGQNLQANHADLRAEADLEINLQAEMEIETVLMHLENQNEIMIKILEKLDQKVK